MSPDPSPSASTSLPGLPEEAWQTPVVPPGWTVAGMLAHLGGAEYRWFIHVTAGGTEDPPPGEEEGEEGEYHPYAAFTCDWQTGITGR